MTVMETLRVPPHSVDAEQSVIGGLMLDERALAKIADWLVEEDFYRKDHRLIFRAISHLHNASKPVDAVTMGEWFEENGLAELVGGTSYAIQIANTTPSAANIVAYAEIVREKSILRKLIDTGTSIVGSAFEPCGKSSADIVAVASHAISGLAATNRGGLSPIKPALRELAAQQAERYSAGPKLLGLPTPWKDLNRVTKGLRDGVLYIVGARPSMGKSIFAENLASFTALRKERVALFSVEMSSSEVMARAVASRGDIPFDWVEQPKDCDDSETYWQRNTTIMSCLVEAPLIIDDTPAIGINQLVARARREHMRMPLRLIIVDHMHDMHIDPRQEARREYGLIAQGCKTLAKELRCPVVLLAQLNRSVANRSEKRPTLTDLRESGEIEQKGDVILFLHREDYYDSKTHLQGIVELIPAKGRNIRIGETIHLQNRFDRMRLDDLEGDLPSLPEQESHGRRNRFSKVA